MRVERGISIESIETIDSTDTTQEVEFKTSDGRSFRQEWQFDNVDEYTRADINEVIENNNPGVALSLLEAAGEQTSGVVLGREQDIATEGLKDFFVSLSNKWTTWKNDPKRQLRKKDGIFKTNNQIRKVILNTLLNDAWIERVTISERAILSKDFLPMLDCGATFNEEAPLASVQAAIENMSNWATLYQEACIKYASALTTIYENAGKKDLGTIAREYAKVDFTKYMDGILYSRETDIANNVAIKFDQKENKLVAKQHGIRSPQAVRPLTKEELKLAGNIMLDLLVMPYSCFDGLIPDMPSVYTYEGEDGAIHTEEDERTQIWSLLFSNLEYEGGLDLYSFPHWDDGETIYKALSKYVDASIV